MKQNQSDIDLLEEALAAIEKVLARADSELQGAPYHGPTAHSLLDELSELPQSPEQEFRASAAQSAINVCLSSAAALIDVSQALMNRRTDRTPHDLEREWKTLITHTKTASRSAYRAALIMTAQKHVLAAQGTCAVDEVPCAAH